MPHDLTRVAVQRQLKAMAQDRYEITLSGPDHTSVHVRSAAQILSDLPKLKRANQAGCNIYIRGLRNIDHDLILLDDLNLFTPEKMKSAGHAPAVVIETSPGSIQSWVRLGVKCNASIRHEISRELAQLYGADPGAIDPHQSGRLAGFTNRKPQHRTSKGFPFVLLRNAPGVICTNANALIESAKAKSVRPKEQVKTGTASTDLQHAFESEYRKRPDSDMSQIDFAICCRLLSLGCDPDAIAASLELAAERKGRHAQDYAERTVSAALRSLSDPSPSP